MDFQKKATNDYKGMSSEDVASSLGSGKKGLTEAEASGLAQMKFGKKRRIRSGNF
jgi:hypothetical protein